ncbi:MAG: peptidoglycan DD-metalloendopeptidase family protein [Chloroflexi bacterium]|nr:peptidoglycan DD-metalloendopeptidase family protein [Chloroflexota bacterium]
MKRLVLMMCVGLIATAGELSAQSDDNRVQVTDTRVEPWSGVVWLAIDYYFIDVLMDESTIVSHCTGILIDPYYVLTAGHCVLNQGERIVIEAAMPGRNGNIEPFGRSNVVDIYIAPQWEAMGGDDTLVSDTAFDYAVLRLEEPFEETSVFTLYPADDDMLSEFSNELIATGYPGDKPDFTLWHSTGSIIHLETDYFVTDHLAFGGQSGGPLFVIDDGFYVIGMQSNKVPGSHILNSVRVSPELILQLMAWNIPFQLPENPSNDLVENAYEITALPLTLPQANNNAETTLSDPVPSCGNNVGKTVWYRWESEQLQDASLSVLGQGFDPVVSVWDSNLGEIDCSTQLEIDTFITFRAKPGETYYIMVGGSYDRVGLFTVSMQTIPSVSVDSGVPPNTTSTEITPALLWPLNDDFTIMNYIDNASTRAALGISDCPVLENRRFLPDGYCYQGHTGIDITSGVGDVSIAGQPVYSAHDGVVVEVRRDCTYSGMAESEPANCQQGDASLSWQYGNFVRLRAADGTETIYAQLTENVPSHIQPGMFLPAGTHIGYVGDRGYTSFPHLHFELHTPNGEVLDPFESGYWARISDIDAGRLYYDNIALPRDLLARAYDLENLTGVVQSRWVAAGNTTLGRFSRYPNMVKLVAWFTALRDQGMALYQLEELALKVLNDDWDEWHIWHLANLEPRSTVGLTSWLSTPASALGRRDRWTDMVALSQWFYALRGHGVTPGTCEDIAWRVQNGDWNEWHVYQMAQSIRSIYRTSGQDAETTARQMLNNAIPVTVD